MFIHGKELFRYLNVNPTIKKINKIILNEYN